MMKNLLSVWKVDFLGHSSKLVLMPIQVIGIFAAIVHKLPHKQQSGLHHLGQAEGF